MALAVRIERRNLVRDLSSGMQNMISPSRQMNPKKAEKKQSKSQFPNEKDFHAYTKSNQQQEITYTEEKLTKGIELLAQQGLYPLGIRGAA